MIYLDNAATTYPKPAAVYKTVDSYLRRHCGSPGRGGHSMSLAAGKAVWNCRVALCEFFNNGLPERVCFTQNCTYALNLVIKGLLRPYSRVITSNLEHNSVLRPLYSIQGIKISEFNALSPENELLKQVNTLLVRGADALICAHASNILPVVLPVKEIGKLCKKYKVPFIVDAAQSAGIYPIDMTDYGIDILCTPGHKSLYGIQGCGVLIFSADFDCTRLEPIISGGSGMESKSRTMPSVLPEKFEAGTLSTPAIVALNEGIKFINSVGIDTIRDSEVSCATKFADILRENKKVTVYGYGNPVLFNISGIDSEQASLNADYNGVCVRAGLHCSPSAHKANGTLETGAIRASFSYFNTIQQAQRAAKVFTANIKQ